MTELPSFADLLAQLRAGDERAAAAVLQRFSRRLIALARQHLDTWIRRKEDPEDVLQSVYKSFFDRCEKGHFDLVDWNDLWSLLTVITLRKCAEHAHHARAQRRDVGREVEASASALGIDRAPTPVEALALTETVERLMRAFDAADRPIIELSLQGYKVPEIGRRLGRAERTVRRVREQVKKRLLRMQHD